MAVYKVIQDIESEDRLLGPLTFKGLIYAVIVGLCGFINFKLMMTSALGPFKWVLILLLLFPMLLFGVLASPLGREQPTEVWLLSKIRFMLQSRKRIWNQSGVTNLVTITVPKKVEAILSKNFSQDEVKSRLSALATTLDSRGWAIKNININMNAPVRGYESTEEDRLVDTASFVQEVPEVTISAADDILDEQNNPTAQNFQNLMVQAEEQRKVALQEKLATAREEYLALAPEKKTEDKPVIHDLKPQPLVGFGKNAHPIKAAESEASQVTPDNRTDKMELANAGNDLSVSSISRLANRNNAGTGEVAIALH